MNTLRLWILAVIATAMVLSLSHSLMPKGKWETITRLTGGLILLLVMVKPLIRIQWLELIKDIDHWQSKIYDYTNDYAEEQQEELSAIISKQTAAYIQKKGDLTCQIEVLCKEVDGVPFPSEVIIDTPYDKSLSDIISMDLNIDSLHQHWLEE